MSGTPRALLIDITRCAGCRACTEACMESHGYTGDPFEIEALSANAKTVILEKGDLFVRKQCMHCLNPSCSSVCPVGALQKTPEGPVVYDPDRCIGCRYCIQAYPFNIPRYQWDRVAPTVVKCDGCIDRLRQGGDPTCVEACPTESVAVGTCEELIKEAHRRIRENPDTYYPHVYGEKEVGGTSVLYLSPVEFSTLGFNMELGEVPPPVFTQPVLDRIPCVLTIGGSALLGIWWVTKRREEVARAETGGTVGPRPNLPKPVRRWNMKSTNGYLLSAWQGVFYLLLATGIVLTVVRFTRGLGAVTNLSDTYPWGLWIGFDILCGVGLAAGGFTISVGLAMIIIESRLSARAFGRQLELPLLTELGRYLMTVLGVYGVIRLCDLRYHGELGLIFNGSYESWMFQLEYVVGVLLPFVILAIPKMRESGRGLYTAGLFVVLGFITNRLNVSITGLEGAQGGHYVPALSEVIITLMLIAVGFGAFSLAVRYLNVYPSETGQEGNRDPSPPFTVHETVSTR